VQPLKSTTTPLLIGAIPNQEPEPVAWTNLSGPQKTRVFNTSLGHPEDFTSPQFRKLLTNGIFWSLEPQYAGSPPLAAK
jgi:type 1 glutamine amidotransferase